MVNRNNNINLLYYPFRIKILKTIEIANAQGIKADLFEGYRSRQRQQILYDQGRKSAGRIITNASPGQSYHNYGLAGDLVLRIDGKWSWEPLDSYRKLGDIGERFGLKWLGRSKSFPEYVHFQYPVLIDLKQMDVIYKLHGIEAIWDYIDTNWGVKNHA